MAKLPLNVITLNVNGLNSAVKRTRVLEYLHRKSVSIALIQETHLKHCDVYRFQNKYYKVAISSSAQNRTKGVAILVKRRLPLFIDQVGNDQEGRYAFIKARLGTIRLVLASVYCPNELDREFLNGLCNTLLELSDSHLLVGGDFNAVMNPKIDKSSSDTSSSLPSKLLNQFIGDLNIIDLWRLKNNTLAEYTFYSHRHKSYSRIDYIFVSPSLFSAEVSIAILPILLSDHSAVFCSFLFPDIIKAPRWRFNSSLLTNSDFLSSLKAELQVFISINRSQNCNPQILWEATKCFIRGFCISFSSTLSKSQKQCLNDLENNIKSLETLQKQCYSEDRMVNLRSLKEQHKFLSIAKAEFILHRTRHKYYLDAERPSHLLALRLKECETKAYINGVLNSNDQLITDPPGISRVFKAFYSQLYKSEIAFDAAQCKTFLDELQLPVISQLDRDLLDAPIELDELHKAIKDLQKGKSPGLDGLPPELYLDLWDLVGTLILDSFNFAIESGSFHRDQKTALISLLLKKGKDPLQCSSYRPISLICGDVKLFAKVLSLRLETVIPALISEDQSGFIKGRLASDNIRRLFHVLDAAHTFSSPCAVFSLDAEKAFDRLEWSYMWAVLERFGFGAVFISMLQTLYNSPMASVLTNNIISPAFQLERGTRQGCPLSPHLFCLSLEPLAQAIRQSSIYPINIHGHSNFISLYADDIVLYLDNLDTSIQLVMKIFDTFNGMSGYKINWSKSVLMPLNKLCQNVSIPSIIPVKESFAYLGIDIYPDIHKSARENYIGMLGKIKRDLERWNGLKVSLQGRIATIKMNVLPRLNFLFFMLPLPPPLKYFAEIDSMVSKFLWNNKQSRIRLATLQLPKTLGGLAVPNFKLYFMSFQLRALRSWLDPESKTSWRAIESILVRPHRLQDLLFTGAGSKNTDLKFGCIVAHSLKIWSLIEKLMGGPFKICSATPLWQNYKLLRGARPFIEPSWSSKGINVCGDLYDDGGFLSFQSLKVTFNLPASTYFVYLQLRSALKAYGVPWDSRIATHPMVKWIQPHLPSRGCVARIYRSLIEASANPLTITTLWDKELATLGYTPEWDTIWSNLSLTSKNVAHQLIHFKLIHRAYLTPYRRFKMKIQTNYYCHICNTSAPGTFLHMFWECPVIVKFWRYVNTVLSDILEIEYNFDPCLCLLNDNSNLELKMTQCKLLFSGFTAAKKTILQNWITPGLHMESFWVVNLLNIAKLECTAARLHHAKPITVETWQTFVLSILDFLQSMR
uniref:Reverse transcriptase domain-containing protein n=1 Tax=Astyanax mexicanus TaxID=7994 RepID=A0A3B1KHZ5_ASTMX